MVKIKIIKNGSISLSSSKRLKLIKDDIIDINDKMALRLIKIGLAEEVKSKKGK